MSNIQIHFVMHLYAEHVLDDIYPVHLLEKLERENPGSHSVLQVG